MYGELVEQIKELFLSKDVVVIAISGHGGSGKTTLAQKIAKDFGVDENQIVRIDSVHAKNYLEVEDLFEAHEWSVIKELLSKIHSSDRLKYRTRDWKGIEGQVDVARPDLIIVEGIRLIRPDTATYFDLSVWIDCPIEVASKRAVERNRKQGDSKEELDLWHIKWIPEAKRYVEQVHPEKIADFIYTEW